MANFSKYASWCVRSAVLSVLLITGSVFANSDPITSPTKIDCQN